MVKRRILLLKLKRAFLESVSRIKLTVKTFFLAINCYVESVNMAFLRFSVSSLMAVGPHFTYFPTPISFLETALTLSSGTDKGDRGNDIVPAPERSLEA